VSEQTKDAKETSLLLAPIREERIVAYVGFFIALGSPTGQERTNKRNMKVYWK
jgi:hypothetical protein